uniref:Uncharacterized protein n=1 Tax=Siphoviridae sp. ctKgQ2 TaxID=2827842 RepID=A0A8S5TLP5_9CAUD|nr:MAG TPA: hypothetical protein [Siphoviridae sp. ctKgQ2]
MLCLSAANTLSYPTVIARNTKAMQTRRITEK